MNQLRLFCWKLNLKPFFKGHGFWLEHDVWSFIKVCQFVGQVIFKESIGRISLCRACFRPKTSALKIHQSVSCNLEGQESQKTLQRHSRYAFCIDIISAFGLLTLQDQTSHSLALATRAWMTPAGTPGHAMKMGQKLKKVKQFRKKHEKLNSLENLSNLLNPLAM